MNCSLVGLQVFQFADKYRGPYSNGLKRVVCPFYCSYSGYEVKLIISFYLYKGLKKEGKKVYRNDTCHSSPVPYGPRLMAMTAHYFLKADNLVPQLYYLSFMKTKRIDWIRLCRLD